MSAVLPPASHSAPVHSSASLYVGDLSPDVSENKLYEVFNNIGQVQSVRVLRDHTTRRSLGYAYVNFQHADHAEKALEIMNFKVITDRPCRIMWSQRDPNVRKSGKGNIFVKNLAKSIDHEQLRDTFAHYGPILSCKVQTNKLTGESLGYGFVHFSNEADALEAIQNANGCALKDQVIEVAPFVGRGQRTKGFTNLFYKNVPRTYSQKNIEDMFAEHGEITSSKFMPAPPNDEKKVCHAGFVNFKTQEQAKTAQEALNHQDLGEKKLQVFIAQRKEERNAELKRKNELVKDERFRQMRGQNLYVKNLGDNVDDTKLNEMFARFGQITSGKIMIDEKTKKSKGFGFVCFQTTESAMQAVSLNGQMFDGKPLYVSMAQRKSERINQIEQNMARRNKPQGGGYMGPYPGAGMPRAYPQGPPMAPWGAHPMMGRPIMAQGPGQYQLVPQQGPSHRGGGGPGTNRGPRGGGRGGRVHDGGRGMGRQFAQHPRENRGPRDNNRIAQAPAPQPVEPQVAVEPAELSTTDFIKAAASLPDQKRKHVFGERLFPMVAQSEPDLAPKITGMLLEMEDTEIVELLESPQALEKKIQEAIAVLNEAQNGEE